MTTQHNHFASRHGFIFPSLRLLFISSRSCILLISVHIKILRIVITGSERRGVPNYAVFLVRVQDGDRCCSETLLCVYLPGRHGHESIAVPKLRIDPADKHATRRNKTAANKVCDKHALADV